MTNFWWVLNVIPHRPLPKSFLLFLPSIYVYLVCVSNTFGTVFIMPEPKIYFNSMNFSQGDNKNVWMVLPNGNIYITF